MTALAHKLNGTSRPGPTCWAVRGIVLGLAAASPPAVAERGAKGEVELEDSRIYIEYNASDNDLGFHVAIDGEDWRSMRIYRPDGKLIFDVTGRAGYRDLGMTELFFEGAEPELNDVPLDELLALFPEGEYEFEGVTVDGAEIAGEGELSHCVPAGPVVYEPAVVGGLLEIHWDAVDSIAVDAAGGRFPDCDVEVVAYQVIVDSFQVTIPADGAPTMSVTVPPEFVASFEPGEHDWEVLAIEASGNQTITAGTFEVEP